MKTKPWMMLVAMLAGWINRQQQEAIEYLKEVCLSDGVLQAKILVNISNSVSWARFRGCFG